MNGYLYLKIYSCLFVFLTNIYLKMLDLMNVSSVLSKIKQCRIRDETPAQ